MKRLFLMIAACACVAAPLGEAAWAQGRGRGDDRRGGPRVERQYAPPERARAGRGEGRRWDERRDAARRYGDDRRAGPRRRADEDRGPPRPRYQERRRFEDRPPPPAFVPPRARRGGYLPDGYRGGVVDDYRRYRLRPPPHGYAWVRVGNGFALVSEASGQVFDVIPD